MTPDAYGSIAFWFTFVPLFFILYRMMQRGEFPPWSLPFMAAMFVAGQFGEILQFAAKYFALRFL